VNEETPKKDPPEAEAPQEGGDPEALEGFLRRVARSDDPRALLLRPASAERRTAIRERALRFSRERFQDGIRRAVDECLTTSSTFEP